MAEPTVASVTLLIASWLTPSSLFIFVNLVIGTIAITSRFSASSSSKTRIQEHHHDSPQLVRSPSLQQRLRSFGLTHQYIYDPGPVLAEREPYCTTHPELVRTPSFLERVRSLTASSSEEPAEFTQPRLVRTPSLLKRVRSFNFSPHGDETTVTSFHAEETDHDQTQTNQQEFEEQEQELIRTSGSDQGVKDDEMRKPATTRESWCEDEDVDSKAEDFINRFKEQLRLQRVDSILRSREMLTAN